MKGQFFIISTVIMISAMILITLYLYDYGKVDLTSVEQMQELNYIDDIQSSLRSAVEISCDGPDTLQANLDLAKENLKNSFLEKGIELDIISTGSCAGMQFTVNMKSSEFDIENIFSV